MELRAPAYRPPEWQGWLALGVVVCVFSVLVWWLYFSPLRRPVRSRRVSEQTLRARHIVAALALLGGTSWNVGGYMDTLWHRKYGGFGDDFFWPPHLLIYAS